MVSVHWARRPVVFLCQYWELERGVCRRRRSWLSPKTKGYSILFPLIVCVQWLQFKGVALGQAVTCIFGTIANNTQLCHVTQGSKGGCNCHSVAKRFLVEVGLRRDFA